MLFIIHFKNKTSKAYPLRDWQLLSQQCSKLLLTSGNRKPRVTPEFHVCDGLGQPTKMAHRGTLPLQKKADN